MCFFSVLREKNVLKETLEQDFFQMIFYGRHSVRGSGQISLGGAGHYIPFLGVFNLG